jgi:hypothetical protein
MKVGFLSHLTIVFLLYALRSFEYDTRRYHELCVTLLKETLLAHLMVC